VRVVRLSPDGILYTGGTGSLLVNSLYRWNGSAWWPVDTEFVDVPGATVYAIDFGIVDSVIPTNYDIFVGEDGTAIAAAPSAGTATVTNDGTALAYPLIVIEQDGVGGGDLKTIRNETLGLEIIFNDYQLQNGETLTIDTSQPAKPIISSFFGSRQDAVLAGSDLGQWALQPGANQITFYIDTGTPAIFTAYLLWQDTYKSYD